MIRQTVVAASLVLLLSTAASAAASDDPWPGEVERPIPLAQVPKAAMRAAAAALNAAPTAASSILTRDARRAYKLEAQPSSAGGRSVHVTGNGRLLKREIPPVY